MPKHTGGDAITPRSCRRFPSARLCNPVSRVLTFSITKPATSSYALAEFTWLPPISPWIIFRAAHLHGVPAPALRPRPHCRRSSSLRCGLRAPRTANRPRRNPCAFYRSLDDLEAAGLIVRPPQRRYGEAGLFGRAYLHRTEQIAQLLGLVNAPAIASAPEPDHHDAVTPEVLSLQQPSASVADGAIYKHLYPASSQKRQPGQLPSDLERLRRLGFHEFPIFKLMREAREHQKLLSDVVDVAWDHLRKAQRPINYLRALLRSTADFAWQARNKRQAAARRHEADQEALRVATVVQQNAGGIFFDCNSSRRISVASDASMVTAHECGEAAPRVSAGNWQVNFVAAIKSGHLVPATTEREAAFESKRQRGREDRQAAPRLQPTHAMPRILTEEAGERLAQMKNLLRATVAGVCAH